MQSSRHKHMLLLLLGSKTRLAGWSKCVGASLHTSPCALLPTTFSPWVGAPVGTQFLEPLPFCMSFEQRPWWHFVLNCIFKVVFSKQPWKTETVSLSRAERQACLLSSVIKTVSPSETRLAGLHRGRYERLRLPTLSSLAGTQTQCVHSLTCARLCSALGLGGRWKWCKEAA